MLVCAGHTALCDAIMKDRQITPLSASSCSEHEGHAIYKSCDNIIQELLGASRTIIFRIFVCKCFVITARGNCSNFTRYALPCDSVRASLAVREKEIWNKST